MNNMKPIKTIAGDLLLFFYVQQRKFGSIQDALEFSEEPYGAVHNNGKELASNSQLAKAILGICENSNDAYFALCYLGEKGFMNWTNNQASFIELFFNLRVTASGVDIIEGVERGKDERNQFNLTFNIKLADNINIDSLIKNQLDSLIRASLI